MSDMDNVVRELAVKHGIAIGRDDPVLMLATLQEIMLRNLQERQSASLADFHSQLEVMMSSWSTDSNSKAERIVNGALDAAKRSMTQLQAQQESNLNAVFDKKGAELSALLAEIRSTQQEGIRWLYWIAGGALGVSLIALICVAFG